MRRFLTKTQSFLLTSFLGTVALLTILGNILLTKAIERTVPLPFTLFGQTSITAEKINYLFPHNIIIHNLSIKTSPNRELLRSSSTVLRFSLTELMKTRRVNVDSLTFYTVTVDYPQLKEFVQQNIGPLQTLLESLPKKNFAIAVHNIHTPLPNKKEILGNLGFTLKGDTFTSTGTFLPQPTASASLGQPLTYEIKGLLANPGFMIDNLVIRQGNFYSDFWGEWKSPNFGINGFCFIENEKKISSAQEREASIIHKVREFRQRRARSSVDTGGLYILDIVGSGEFRPGQLQLSNLEFTLNNIPVKLKGHIALKKESPVNLELTVLPPPHGGAAVFTRADMKISGNFSGAQLHSDGTLNILLSATAPSALFPTQVIGNFKDMVFSIDMYRRLALKINNTQITWGKTIPTDHILNIQDFSAALNFLADRTKIISFHTPIEDGVIDGKLWMDTGQLPTRTTAAIRLQDIETSRLEALLIYFSKIHGRLNGKLTFDNTLTQLSGDLWINNGVLLDFDFFKWLAETFAVPALHKIAFEKLSTHFSLNQQGVHMDQLALQSPEVKFKGNFQIGENNLVASKLSFTFARELMETSPKTRQILKLFDNDLSAMFFDFQLSGNPDAVNFQWLDNEAKRRIQAAIPDFIQRRIEKNIDLNTSAAPAEMSTNP